MMLSFSVKGCRVWVGFSCFALAAFCCLFLGGENSASFLAAAACHEGGHLVLLFLLGAPPAMVKLTALGCRMVPNREKLLSYGQMALVSFAGPGVNLLCGGGMFLLGWRDHPFLGASLALGLLHSLPVEPMDGGMALRALLCARMNGEQAGKLSLVISLGVLFPMAVLGFLVLLRTRYNFTLLAMSLYLMLYLLLKRDLFSG